MNNTKLVFTQEEKDEIQNHVSKYPAIRSAIMPALWIAQEKFGWLSDDAITLVANELKVPVSQVYGVATFYTMYIKKDSPKHLIDICTCFTCGECGGREVYEHAKDYINADEKGFGDQGKVWIRQAECLGACDTATVAQVSNKHFVHNLSKDSIEELIEDLRNGIEPKFKSIPLSPQEGSEPIASNFMDDMSSSQTEEE